MDYETIDLFAGAGGFTAGLARAGLTRPTLAVESDAECAETFSLNFPEATVLQDDVRSVDFEGCRAQVVVGGPPCQGFSTLNRNRTNDPRNALSTEVVRCVAAVSPEIVVVENVTGFVRSEEGRLLEADLEQLGYSVRAGVVNCADFGVPQRRQRAVVIASRPGVPIPWPRGTHSARRGRLPSHRTVADAFALLPAEADGRNWHVDTYRERSSQVERLRSIREGGSRTDLPPDLVLDCWKEAKGYRDVLGRLEWHKPSTTVRTEFFRPEKGRFLHPTEDRPITPREAARLQSFPDSFRFPEDHSLYSVGRQIGNAVPPALAEAIGRAIERVLTRRAAAADRMAERSSRSALAPLR